MLTAKNVISVKKSSWKRRARELPPNKTTTPIGLIGETKKRASSKIQGGSLHLRGTKKLKNLDNPTKSNSTMSNVAVAYSHNLPKLELLRAWEPSNSLRTLPFGEF